MDLEFFRRLCESPAPTGFEGPLRTLVRERMSAVGRPESDPLGNVWIRSGSDGPQIVAVAHGDQIGLVITWIDEQGFLSFERIGGVDRQLLPGRRLTIHSVGGPVQGVVGRRPTHFIPSEERGKAPEFHEQYIDIGATSRKDALRRVAVGDPVTFAADFVELAPGVVACQACDDRAGVYAVCRALELYSADPAASCLTTVITVHEETTFLGARAQTHRLRPDVVIVVDADFATDQPDVDVKKAGGEVKLGAGPVVFRGTASNHKLHQRAVKTAKRAGIPIQIKAAGGAMSTDADELMAAERAATLSLGIPMRYMHSPYEVVHTADLEATAELVAAIARDLAGIDDQEFLW